MEERKTMMEESDMQEITGEVDLKAYLYSVEGDEGVVLRIYKDNIFDIGLTLGPLHSKKILEYFKNESNS